MRINIYKRSFIAKDFPKGSKDREILNSSTMTSEYQPSKKFVVVRHFDETERTIPHSRIDSFETRNLALVFARAHGYQSDK